MVKPNELDLDFKFVQSFLLMPQLRHMISTRRSAKVAVKDKQQPMIAVNAQFMQVALGIVEFKRDSFFACQIFHLF